MLLHIIFLCILCLKCLFVLLTTSLSILQQWWSKVLDYSSSPQWSSCRVLWKTVPVSPCFTSRQDYWTSCSCIEGNLHEFQKSSKTPSISTSDGFHIDIRHLAMSDLPSLSNNRTPQTLASHVKDGHDWSLLWAWNFPTPDVITLPSSFEEDGTWSNMEVAGCSFATAASPWLLKRKLRREKHWRLSAMRWCIFLFNLLFGRHDDRAYI